jgi:hypothetical protein
VRALPRPPWSIAAPGRNRQPAIAFRALASFGGAEQPAVFSAGAVIASGTLFRRLVALAAQFGQTGMNRRKIIGSTGSGHVSS